jgi:hypothetical protein
MRFSNLVGNKVFSLLFSWLLGQHVKDTLCGTKVLRKSNYDKIAAGLGANVDPFGDFELLIGSAQLNLKIVDFPVRYGARTYGETKIARRRDGWLLLRMAAFAYRKLKLEPVRPG